MKLDHARIATVGAISNLALLDRNRHFATKDWKVSFLLGSSFAPFPGSNGFDAAGVSGDSVV